MDSPAAARPLSRRRLLAISTLAAPLAAVASCAVPGPLAGPPGPSPEVRALRSAIAAEQSLLRSYRAVLTAHPGLAGSLRVFLGQHEDHLRQLQDRLVLPPHVTPSPSPSPSQPPSPPAPPAQPGAAVAFLATAERSAASAQMGRLAGATPSLAQLLASIAASEATHAVSLSALKPAGG